MRRLLLFGFASLALLAAGCGGTSTANLSADDVAVVGGAHITKDDFQALMGRAKKSYDAQKRAFPKAGSTEYEQLKGQAITFLVQQAEVEEQAKKLGIDVRYEKAVKQQGLTDDQAREAIRQQLISQALFKKVTGDMKVSDADIKQ